MRRSIIAVLFLLCLYSLESQTMKFDNLSINDFFSLSKETIYNDVFYRVIINRKKEEQIIYEYKNALFDYQLSWDKRSIYCLVKLAGSSSRGAIWKYDGDLGKSYLIGRTGWGFKISKDEKYIITLEPTEEYEVDDFCIYTLEDFYKVKYFVSQDIILEKFPESEYPEDYWIEIYNNYIENGVDIVFNQWGEAGPETFTIFISFDDLEYSFTERTDLYPEIPNVTPPGP